MYSLTAALAVFQHDSAQDLKEALRIGRARTVAEAVTPVAWPEFLEDLEGKRPDILIVDLGSLSGTWEELLQGVRTASPSTLVVAMHTAADPEMILGAIRAGASECIYPPYQETLRKALERLEEERARKASQQGAKSRTVGLISAKGGCGATTIACRLAPALQRLTKREVLLADFDLHFGLISFLLKRKSPYSVLDALRNVHRLDLDYWKALTANVVPGVDMISAPPPQEVQNAPDPESLFQILRFVRGYYEWVLLDLGRGLSNLCVSLAGELDELLVVATPEVPALYQAKRVRETARMLGVGVNRLRLIINRAPKGLALQARELEEMIGMPVTVILPDDPKSAENCFVDGKSLAAGGRLGQEVDLLAARLSGMEEDRQKKRPFLFSRGSAK